MNLIANAHSKQNPSEFTENHFQCFYLLLFHENFDNCGFKTFNKLLYAFRVLLIKINFLAKERKSTISQLEVTAQTIVHQNVKFCSKSIGTIRFLLHFDRIALASIRLKFICLLE